MIGVQKPCRMQPALSILKASRAPASLGHDL
jgi:hypothetical protein